MKTSKYTQNVYGYPRILLPILLLAGWLILLSDPAAAQTNDPKLNQQYYIFDHNIDDAWNTQKGSSGTRIAIHSLAGFTTTHEDITGRYLNPSTEWFGPEFGNASEIAGIVGANSNNGTGIAGIDWYGTMKSYNVLREKQSGDNNSAATFTYDNQDYYLDIGKLDGMVNEAIQDNMDIQLFTFGVPSAKTTHLKQYEQGFLSGVNDLMITPGVPSPDPSEPFYNALLNLGKNLGQDLWNTITGNNYIPLTPLEKFRKKLYKFTQTSQNGITLAPAGDVPNQDLLNILMPASFDNYVVTVAGAEKDEFDNYSQWSNSHAASYNDVAAAAKDIVSLSGTGTSAYNNSFSSTAAAAGITGGVVSLLKAEAPNLTHDDIEQVLEQTALDIEGVGKDAKTGHGFVDAQAALNFVLNNDVVHKSVQNTDIQIYSDQEVVSGNILMSSAYDNFSNYSTAETSYGKLRKITGTVKFDNLFQNAPDVWLRMTSSGIDNAIINNSKHYYDPYDKAFKVTSVNEYSFDFELFYWKITYYTSAGQELDTQNIPDVNNSLKLDYTAVGQETSNPVPPPPSKPTGLVLNSAGGPGGQGFPQLDWNDNPESNIDYYEVFRRGLLTIPFEKIGTTSYSNFTDYEIAMDASGEDISYYVRPVNIYGMIGPNSDNV